MDICDDLIIWLCLSGLLRNKVLEKEKNWIKMLHDISCNLNLYSFEIALSHGQKGICKMTYTVGIDSMSH